MTFHDVILRLRRYLRDPEGIIWPDETLRHYFNQAQKEVSDQVGRLEGVVVHHWPPLWSITHIFDWEYRYVDDYDYMYQAFEYWQAGDGVVTYPWEPGHYLDSASALDDGSRFAHPWESDYSAPGCPVPFPFPNDFHTTIYMAHDEDNIDGKTEREIALRDEWYQTHSGSPEYYYAIDDIKNAGVLYPRPSGSTWDDDLSDGWTDAAYSSSDNSASIVDTDNRILLVYQKAPTDISTDTTTWDDALPWPDYWVKYVIYSTLERAYGADTDGFIPSLRDYWKQRRELGQKILQKYLSNRMSDRDLRFGGTMRTKRPRHARLPWTYADRW